MGAWGYGYQESDDYHNERVEYTQPLIDALEHFTDRALRGLYRDEPMTTALVKLEWAADAVIGRLRPQLIETVKMIRAVDGEVSEQGVGVLRYAAQLVRAAAVAGAGSWSRPNVLLTTVAVEMHEVEEWLDSLMPTSFADRIPAILAQDD